MKKTFVIEADDFMPSIGVMDLLQEIKDHQPNFKITLFTIAHDIGYKKGTMDLKKAQQWARIINGYDWIEIACHGFDHREKEFLYLSYEDALHRIKKIEWEFKKTGLKYVKVFRAPYWLASEGTYLALRRKGYAVATDRNQVRPDINGLVQYRWNWSMETPPPEFHIIKGHGHVTKERNDLTKSIGNLLRLPQDSDFLFVSEYLDKFGGD